MLWSQPNPSHYDLIIMLSHHHLTVVSFHVMLQSHHHMSCHGLITIRYVCHSLITKCPAVVLLLSVMLWSLPPITLLSHYHQSNCGLITPCHTVPSSPYVMPWSHHCPSCPASSSCVMPWPHHHSVTPHPHHHVSLHHHSSCHSLITCHQSWSNCN